ncbi:MAG: carboxypeptidase-like regulatory domain-containing protein [Gemmataceae bacterium]|nr:carboxypeptidase-like regulatory domain-containing protein [Gemmataceae bacterium]
MRCRCNAVSFVVVLTLCGIAAAISGCRGESKLTLIPVTGKVVLANGQTMAGIGVQFHPDAGGTATGHIPTGTTDAEGKYELMTGVERGAPPGQYRVVLVPPSPKPVGGSIPPPSPPPFNAKYLDRKTSDLTIEVKAGAAPGTYDLILK